MDFSAMQSPVDLMNACGIKPPSPQSECVLDATQAAQPTLPQRKIWKTLSKMPWPSRPPGIIVRCSGRGSFKTSDGAWWTAYHMLCVDHDEHALEGSRITHGVISSRKHTAADALRNTIIPFDALKERDLVDFDVRDGTGDSIELIVTKPKRRCVRVARVFPCNNVAGRGPAWASLQAVEHGHWPIGPDYRSSEERAVLQSIVPRLAQFPRSQIYSESTCGKPEGTFYEWVTKPPSNSLLVTGASFLFNPGLTEKEARSWCLGDERVYRQEVLCTTWGHGGDSFLDQDACQECLE
jgi:hypothetical protein